MNPQGTTTDIEEDPCNLAKSFQKQCPQTSADDESWDNRPGVDGNFKKSIGFLF